MLGMRRRTALPFAGLLLFRCLPAELELEEALSGGGSSSEAGETATSLGGESGGPGSVGGNAGMGAGEAGTPNGGLGGVVMTGGEAGDAGAPPIPLGSCNIVYPSSGGADAGGRLPDLFDFTPSLDPKDVVVTNSPTQQKHKWAKGFYESTDTKTHLLDRSNNPTTNLANLAFMSLLDVDPEHGRDKPAMRYRIPFSPEPEPVYEPEQVHLLYLFEFANTYKTMADFRGALVTANIMLAKAPSAYCHVVANPWATNQARTGRYEHVDGPSITLLPGEWVTLRLDFWQDSALATIAPQVNQFGFTFQSVCDTSTLNQGAGGMDAGGASGAGGTDGAGGAGESSDERTIILIDNISTLCRL